MKQLWEIWVDWWTAVFLTMVGFRELPEHKQRSTFDE